MLYENISDSIKILLVRREDYSPWIVELVLSPEAMFFSFENNDFGDRIHYNTHNSLKEVIENFEVDINDSEKVLFFRAQYTLPELTEKYYFQNRLFEGIYELLKIEDEKNKNNNYNVFYDSKRNLFIAKKEGYKRIITAKTMYDIKEKVEKRQEKPIIIPSEKSLKEGISLILEDLL